MPFCEARLACGTGVASANGKEDNLMEFLPVQYHLEIYERSFVNDPSLSVSSMTPWPSFAVGDLFDHRAHSRWYKPPGSSEIFRVAEVRHAMWEVKTHVGHKLMIRVEVVPTPPG